MQAKLGLRAAAHHFALVVEHVKSLRRNKLTILDPKEYLSRIASRPGAHNLRCLFRYQSKENVQHNPIGAFYHLKTFIKGSIKNFNS